MVTNKILRKIKSKKRGWVFCAKDFSSFGARNTIDKILSRMADNVDTNKPRQIIRLARGIYYYPILQADIGVIPPNLNAIADAIARNAGISIYPSGALSANMLGLSNQVPAQNIYWTFGKSMSKNFNNNTITFKHVNINPIPNTPLVVVMVINALKYLGKNKVDDQIIRKCSIALSQIDKKYLQKMSSRVSGWISDFIPKILAA